jgi:outer membrane protein
MLKKIKLTTVLLLSLSSPFIMGKVANAELLSLNKCLQEAVSNSPVLKVAESRKNGAYADLMTAKTGLKPRFTISETASSTNNPTYSFMSVLNQRAFSPAMMANLNDPTETTNYNTRFGFGYGLFTGGYVQAGIRASHRAYEAADYETVRARQQIQYNVKSAYLRVIIARKKIGVADKALETANAHAKIAQDMYKNGLIVESDKLSAGVRVSEIEQMKLQAENDLNLAKAALLMTMGVDQGRDFDVDPSELEKKDFKGEQDYYIKTAWENRPELKAMDSAALAKKGAVEMAVSAKRPHVFLMGNYDLDNSTLINNDGQSWFMGVSVNVNIGDGGETKYKSRKERAGLDELKWQREQLKQGVELEVRQAYMNVQTAIKGMEVMNRAVEQAETSLKIIENRYSNGLSTNVDVLMAESARTQTQTAYLGALFQYLVGIETLKLAAGIE